MHDAEVRRRLWTKVWNVLATKHTGARLVPLKGSVHARMGEADTWSCSAYRAGCEYQNVVRYCERVRLQISERLVVSAHDLHGALFPEWRPR